MKAKCDECGQYAVVTLRSVEYPRHWDSSLSNDLRSGTASGREHV
jgi:hypothetical protein